LLLRYAWIPRKVA